jgi:hypothetical protein
VVVLAVPWIASTAVPLTRPVPLSLAPSVKVPVNVITACASLLFSVTTAVLLLFATLAE